MIKSHEPCSTSVVPYLAESTASQELQNFILVAQRAENLVLDKLVVPVSCGRALRSSSCRLLNVSVTLWLFVRSRHGSTYLLHFVGRFVFALEPSSLALLDLIRVQQFDGRRSNVTLLMLLMLWWWLLLLLLLLLLFTYSR